MTVSFTKSGKPKQTIDSVRTEKQFANVIRLFLAGELPEFNHQRHVHVANILHHVPYGRELMHLGLQTMAYRHFVPNKYKAEVTDRYWDQLDGTLPDPSVFDDLPGGACGTRWSRSSSHSAKCQALPVQSLDQGHSPCPQDRSSDEPH